VKKLVVIGVFAAAALAVILLWPSDENRVRKVFAGAAEAAAARDVDGFMALISYSYRDDFGMSYLALKEQLKSQFALFSNISVEYEEIKPRIEGDKATVLVRLRVVATTGSDTGYVLGDVKTPLALTVELVKERARWFITKAQRD